MPRVLILGASYGSLFGTKLLMAGQTVALVCTRPTAELINRDGTVVEVDHPTRGKYLTVGNPIKLSDSPAEVRRSPLLGEHSEEILRKVLGFSEAEIEAARKQGAI